MVVSDAQGTLHSATPHQTIRTALDVLGVGSAVLLRPYRGRRAALTVDGTSSAVITAHRSIRAGLTVTIGDLSADDVTGAVLEAPVEGSKTLKQIIRAMAAVLLGKTTVADLGGGLATVTFRDVNDTVDRVVADMDGSERSAVTFDLG
jgi:hypothetical protein